MTTQTYPEEAVAKVLDAISNPKWDFQTVESLARETGLSEAQIEAILRANPDLFRESPVRGRSGESFFTSRKRPVRLRERIALLQQVLKG